jgi:hypothetical protein
MFAKRVVLWLLSSIWVRAGAIALILNVIIDLIGYTTTGRWPRVWLEIRFMLFFAAGAALELWLRTHSAKAIMAPFAARLDKTRIWRELNKPVTCNSPSLTFIVTLLMIAAMMTIIWASMMLFMEGINQRALDGFLSGWPFIAFIAGFGILWLIFYHAGIDPTRAIDKLFLWGWIGAIGFVAGGFWTIYNSDSKDFNALNNHQTQRAFRNAILSTPVPCVSVQDKLSDLSGCTVFGLRPGMTQGESMRGVNGSGYFREIGKPSACKTSDKCSHYVTFIKDGLYVRIEFKTDPKSDDAAEQVSGIVLCLDEGANPYFDENEVMATFLKRIGPNGFSTDNFTVWRDIKNDLELHAYTYDNKFWAVFSRLGDRLYTPGSGVRV